MPRNVIWNVMRMSLKNDHMTALSFFDLTFPCPRMFAFIAFIRNEVNYLAVTFWC